MSNNQVAFVRGRKLGDHVLLAQALCKDYHIHRGPPRIAFKLDISKAFDSLSWEFLFKLLELQGFNPLFLNWLRGCITQSMISIKVNGALEGYFRCKSGLKQGDPLSPYLFVLAMEALSACINSEILSGGFKYHYRAKDSGITHLTFADDVLLFCYGDNDSVSTIMRAIGKFSAISGLCLNPSKCVTFFGNAPSAVQDFTIATSGFNRGSLPVTYLGLPLISGKLNTRDCQPLVSKITARMESWNSNYISQAGRAQLIKSVVFGIQNHWTMYLFLPKKILRRIQSIMSRFLWKGSSLGPCHYKVSWKQCCLRKEEGGLGFKELLSWNQCAIQLQVWRIIKHVDDSLWLDWVHKYILKRKGFWTMSIPAGCSWGLRKILNARIEVKSHISYRIGRDSQFLLWHDLWTGDKPLLEQLGSRAISSLESDYLAKVNSIIRDGVWSLGVSNEYTIMELRSICAGIAIHERDDILWDDVKYNDMRIGTIWDNIRPTGSKPIWFNFVWSKLSTPKYGFTAWLILQEKLLTKDRMVNFRMNVHNQCELCGVGMESHEHIFCHCPYIRSIFATWYKSITASWSDMQVGNVVLSPCNSKIDTDLTRLFILTAFYMVWKERNTRLHDSDTNHHRSSASILKEVKSDMRAILASSVYFNQCITSDPTLVVHLY